MNDYEKIDWVSFAIQEAINGNPGELSKALKLVEMLRWNHEHLKFEDYCDESIVFVVRDHSNQINQSI